MGVGSWKIVPSNPSPFFSRFPLKTMITAFTKHDALIYDTSLVCFVF